MKYTQLLFILSRRFSCIFTAIETVDTVGSKLSLKRPLGSGTILHRAVPCNEVLILGSMIGTYSERKHIATANTYVIPFSSIVSLFSIKSHSFRMLKQLVSNVEKTTLCPSHEKLNHRVDADFIQ